MSHKRGPQADSSPSPKRTKPSPKPSKPPPPSKSTEHYIYLAVEEMYGPYMETTQEVFECYATVEDANQRLLARQKRRHVAHFPDWETRYDEYGCLHSKAEDGEGDGQLFDVRRLRVLPEGSAARVGAGSEERERKRRREFEEFSGDASLDAV